MTNLPRPFRLPDPVQRLCGPAAPILSRVLGLNGLNSIYREVKAAGPACDFIEESIDQLGVGTTVPPHHLERIPKAGPVVVVANHPFGIADGLLLTSLLRRVRPDCKAMANRMLGCMPELDPDLIQVDVFGDDAANMGPLRNALRWLKGDHLLAVFPAGEVAHSRRLRLAVEEGPWSPTVARMIRATRATVVPVYFDGSNSAMFQCLGWIHPMLRTAWLGRETLNKRGKALRVRIGNPIPWDSLREISDDDELAQHLRARTLILKGRDSGRSQASSTVSSRPAPLALETEPDRLREELHALPADQLLVRHGNMRVYLTTVRQSPNVVREIGRLRELTFREVHEGTGKSLDIDIYDSYYRQLIVWDDAESLVVGAYRLGLTDEILESRGPDGLYTSSLFRLSRRLLSQISPAIELGRSFVRPEYQRTFSPLMLLWKGIGQFVAANPRYRMLMGPVSINNEYRSVSKELMISFLRHDCLWPELAQMVKARNPHRTPRQHRKLSEVVRGRTVRGIEDVDTLVAEIEADSKGVPVLLRQYLKLGARVLGFNVDPEFGDVLDGLMLVDLARTDSRVLTRYMGAVNTEAFLRLHGVRPVVKPTPASVSARMPETITV